jgi:hypothetical protein
MPEATHRPPQPSASNVPQGAGIVFMTMTHDALKSEQDLRPMSEIRPALPAMLRDQLNDRTLESAAGLAAFDVADVDYRIIYRAHRAILA